GKGSIALSVIARAAGESAHRFNVPKVTAYFAHGRSKCGNRRREYFVPAVASDKPPPFCRVARTFFALRPTFCGASPNVSDRMSDTARGTRALPNRCA